MAWMASRKDGAAVLDLAGCTAVPPDLPWLCRLKKNHKNINRI